MCVDWHMWFNRPQTIRYKMELRWVELREKRHSACYGKQHSDSRMCKQQIWWQICWANTNFIILIHVHLIRVFWHSTKKSFCILMRLLSVTRNVDICYNKLSSETLANDKRFLFFLPSTVAVRNAKCKKENAKCPSKRNSNSKCVI